MTTVGHRPGGLYGCVVMLENGLAKCTQLTSLSLSALVRWFRSEMIDYYYYRVMGVWVGGACVLRFRISLLNTPRAFNSKLINS